MAVHITFDGEHNVVPPTLVLTTRSGVRIGKIPAVNIVYKDGMNDFSEMSFNVTKPDCEWILRESKDAFWEKLADFRLVWVKDWDMYFELNVELSQSADTVKSVSARSLAESELSQLNVYNMEVNTEDDIARDDYSPTVLYNPDNTRASLIHRLLERAPHYNVGHVDESIRNIQRTFTFNDKSIRDAFQEIGTEIQCLFIMRAKTASGGGIERTIDVYDLETYCRECGARGEFTDVCEKCGSDNLKHGYGEDTTIFCSVENLADSVRYTTDNDSVKNCFRLEAGDDLMTATVASMNPNGSQYIWRISEEMKEDMTDELRDALDRYDELYAYYENETEDGYSFSVPSGLKTQYNNLVRKYSVYGKIDQEIPDVIRNYPGIIEVYYNAIDFYYYLSHELMPDVTMASTSAEQEASKLASSTSGLSPVAVKSMASASVSTVNSAVLAMAKVIVDNRYSVSIVESSYAAGRWIGKFKIVNVADEEDTAQTGSINVTVNDNLEKYIKQKIDIALKKSVTADDITNIVDMFSKDTAVFTNELKKYCLSRLTALYDCCRACIDILTEQGISNKSQPGDLNFGLYDDIYLPYYNKYKAVESEMALRDSEIAVIAGIRDETGVIVKDGVESVITAERRRIQNELNLEKFLGDTLWREMCSYRRDDTYRNENYISDGLSNAEIVEKASQFIEVAQKEINKASILQGGISASLKNLLAIKEFEPLTQYFNVGNWIRVEVDGTVYRLRLIQYEISFDNFESISVSFSEVTKYRDYMADIASVLNQAASMASSYTYVARQAKKGSEGNSKLNNWVNNGLSLTNMKIVESADNQNFTIDSHGLLGREFDNDTGTYDPKQLKIINKGLYLTDDAWETSRAGIGEFIYYDPKTGEFRDAYGVIADTIVGNIILSKEVGVYTENGNITMDSDGLTITADVTDEQTDVTKLMSIVKKQLNQAGDPEEVKMLQIDSDGNLVFNGSAVKFTVSGESDKTIDDIMDSAANAVTRVDVEYALSNSSTTAPTSGWSTIAPEWQDGKYMWQRTAMYKAGSDTPVYSDATNITGAKGQIGSNGLNTATVYLYKRSSTTVTIDWTNSLEYSFVTNKLTAAPTGWFQSVPTGTDPLYVTAATASATGNTDNIAYTEWSTPVVLAKNGEDGDSGSDGLNTATVYLYKRSESAPDKPSVDIVYTFASGAISVVGGTAALQIEGWSRVIPSMSEDGVQCYIIQAMAISSDDTATISESGWSEPELFNGVGIANAKEIYYLSTTYGDDDTTPSLPTAPVTTGDDLPDAWSVNMPSYINGAFYFVSTEIKYTDGTVGWSQPAAASAITSSNSEIANVSEQVAEVNDYMQNRFTEINTTTAGLEVSVGSVRSTVEGMEETIGSYFKFDEEGMHISKTGSDADMHIVNDLIEILVAGSTAMTLDRSGLNAMIANVTTIMLGPYRIAYNNNGHMTIS